jgi:hypothetical protein
MRSCNNFVFTVAILVVERRDAMLSHLMRKENYHITSVLGFGHSGTNRSKESSRAKRDEPMITKVMLPTKMLKIEDNSQLIFFSQFLSHDC